MITFPVLLTSGDTAFDTLTRQMAHLRFSVTFSPFAAEARKLVSRCRKQFRLASLNLDKSMARAPIFIIDIIFDQTV